MKKLQRIKLPRNSDDNVCEYTFHGTGRLILNTIHGIIMIDILSDHVTSLVHDRGLINGSLRSVLLRGK